jgi:hypothetical protein
VGCLFVWRLAGDAKIWVSVDASGAANLADVVRVIHAAGIKIMDPIADIKD